MPAGKPGLSLILRNLKLSKNSISWFLIGRSYDMLGVVCQRVS